MIRLALSSVLRSNSASFSFRHHPFLHSFFTSERVLGQDARGILSRISPYRVLATAARPSFSVPSGVDVDADLRAALAQEKVDASVLDPEMWDTLRLLARDPSCRTDLRGEWNKLVMAKIKWAGLLREYDKAKTENKNGETAVQNYVKEQANLTPGAASSLSRYLYHQVQLSHVTPFMRALGEFPRHIHHGAALSPDLAPWMPENLADAIRDLQTKYKRTNLASAEEALTLAVMPLFERLDKQWGGDGFQYVMGDEVMRPVWWSEARRKELTRLLAVARSIPTVRASGGTASRPSRIWLSGPRQGKTHFMRDCALTLALLHPDALVGYCMYNECQLTPQQIWQLHGSHVPQGDIPFKEFTWKLTSSVTPFFFSDELEFLYEQRITAPLEQLRDLGKSGYAVSIVTGTVARLPRMISSSHRLPEYVGLPELNHNKHTAQHLPPILSWAEAQDLAKTVAANRWTEEKLKSEEGEKKLRNFCWNFGGSLGAMINHLQENDSSAYKTPPLSGQPFEPSNIVIGLVSREAIVRGINLGDAFALPMFTTEHAIYELSCHMRSQHLNIGERGVDEQLKIEADIRQEADRALLDLKDRCLIVEVQPTQFRLVHPVHVEWYRTQLMANGCTIGHVQEFRPVGTRGLLNETLIIDRLAERLGIKVLPVPQKDLLAALQRLATGQPAPADERYNGHHMFTSVGAQGQDGVQLRIENGRVLPSVVQYQVKVYASDKYLSMDEAVQKAAVGLATVMNAANVQLNDVTLHVWYFGKPVNTFSTNYRALCELYRDTYLTQKSFLDNKPPAIKTSKKSARVVVGKNELPRVAIELHQADEVMNIIPPTLRAQVELLPEPWKVKRT